MAYTVTDDLRDHYDKVRQARGWSWDTLADYFDKTGNDPASPALAKWAREQAGADKSQRAAKPAKEKRG